jgi:23S rRNA pseudouridine1911/1915/1917 synthase
MHHEEIGVNISETGERLDTFLAGKTGITRSQIQTLIKKGHVLVNATQAAQNHRVKAHDLISLSIPDKETEGLVPEPIPIDILYKDEHCVVVNKPPGMVVYPAAGHRQGTLMNALSYLYRDLSAPGGPLRPGIVHRLDKDTSGVLVIACTDKAYYTLIEQFQQRTINRRYLAIVDGNLREDKGKILQSIGRSDSDRKKMSTRSRRRKEAVTKWKVLKRFCNATFIEVKLGTGRTHQIRVHFASIGHPVLGDKTYGKKTDVTVKGKEKIFFPRQMLHAELLGFIHPVTGEYLEFSSPMPEDMAERIRELLYCQSEKKGILVK